MTRIEEELNTIYFVYLADKIPNYGSASLRLARDMSGSRIHLIGNEVMRRTASDSGANFTAIEDFYSPNSFEQAKEYLCSDANFRNGFWLKSLQRLFVLEQFYFSRGLTSMFHAELDQVLFDTTKMIEALNSLTQKGLYIPFHSRNAVVASVLFVNDLSALQSLTEFAISGKPFNNEMTLMANWASLNPARTFALPTLATELKGSQVILPLGVTQITSAQIGGIVDAAQIGQWVGGIDPRNVPIREKPLTKFVDVPAPELLNREDLSSIVFEIDPNHNKLFCKLADKNFQIYNLHLHSKAHRVILNRDPNFQRLILSSNHKSSTVIPGMRCVQLSTYLSKLLRVVLKNPSKVMTELNSRFRHHLNIRPSSHPLISGDTIRKVSNFVWESNSEKFSPSDVNVGDIIFCESELFDDLSREVLLKIIVPIVLILGNSDKNHTLTEMGKKYLPTGSKIFAQNIMDEIPGFEILPIGIENAWRLKNGLLSSQKLKNASKSRRKFRIMWGFNVGTNLVERGEAFRLLKKNLVADEIKNVSPKGHQFLLSTYAFVASPPGNGLDTHRTWEAMYFKCVPIVVRSFMTSRYESLGLPIWVIDSFEDIDNLDEAFLMAKYNDFKEKFNGDAIWADYWIRLIRETSDSIKKIPDSNTDQVN